MFRVRLGPPLLALALSALPIAPARADGPDATARARELFVEGAKLAEAGKWDAARDHFERSLEQKRAAITLYNLGVAQEETGRVAEAIASFRAFLAMPVEPATAGYVTPVRAALTKLEAKVAQIEIDLRPEGVAGAVVRLDGREVKPASAPWVVDPGRHEVVVTAPRYAEARQTTTVAQGGKAALVITLSPEPASAKLPIVLGASGLALFLGGEILFAAGAARGLDFVPDRGPAKTQMIAGNIIAGTGAVAAGVALVLALRKGRPAQAASAPAIAPWADGRTIGVEARF